MKMMDLRQSTPTVHVCNTRALQGLSIATNGRLLAGFVDNSVSLWDIRRIEKPISVTYTEKNISDMSWCPTRNSTLGTLQRDSPFVHLFDFHCSSPNESVTDIVTHSIKRIISPFQKKLTAAPRNITISNISWHPYDIERLLALSGSGIICDYRTPQRIAISFDAMNNLCGAIGSQLNCLNTQSPPSTPCESVNPWDNPNSTDIHSGNALPEDIVDIMHRRAINDYGKLVSFVRKCSFCSFLMMWKQNKNQFSFFFSFSLICRKMVTSQIMQH